MPKYDPKSATRQRIERTEAYAERVRRQFAATVNEIISLKKRMPTEPGQMYSFDGDTNKVQREVERLLRRLHSVVTTSIETGITLEWAQANKECDWLVQSCFGKQLLKSPMFAAWADRNDEARRAFIERSERGLNLSDRVWQTCRQLRDEMEMAITVAVGEGEDAGSISRQIRHCLNNPDDMFRRFRYKDEDGNWQRKWKKRVKDEDGTYHWTDYDINDYHTGRGVYRSSAKNAMRVARTETNIAYRRADHERWQKMDFVLGQRIQLSKNHPMPDICDELAGDYPKDFVFDGWHPQCFCFVTPILIDEDEIMKMNDAFARGEEYTPHGEPITDYPDGFKAWVRDNADKIAESRARGTEPYFVRNNPEVVQNILTPKKDQANANEDVAKKELTREEILSSFDVLKQRIKAGNIKSTVVISARTAFVNAKLGGDATTEELAQLLNTLTEAVDNADSAIIQNKINKLTPFSPEIKTVKLLADYTSPEDVCKTLNEINDLLPVGRKWGEHGKFSLVEYDDADANGGTMMDGVIKLEKERLASVVSAFSKMAKGVDIDESEADAMCTLWHEINHNRNLWGLVRGNKTKPQTNYMELANEFVSRHTLDELYQSLGIKKVPFERMMLERSSTDYDSMVKCYDMVISEMRLNHGAVLSSVRHGLYRQPYNSQKDVLVSALWENLLLRKKIPEGITERYIDRLVEFCRHSKQDEILDYIKNLFTP